MSCVTVGLTSADSIPASYYVRLTTLCPDLQSQLGGSVYVGLCESSFLLLEYSIEYFIEYSSTRWIPEVAINHRVVQNKRIPGSSFKFVV